MRDGITPTVESIAVIGAGTMGHGIAQVAAGAGYSVISRDLDRDTLARDIQAIERNLEIRLKSCVAWSTQESWVRKQAKGFMVGTMGKRIRARHPLRDGVEHLRCKR